MVNNWRSYKVYASYRKQVHGLTTDVQLRKGFYDAWKQYIACLEKIGGKVVFTYKDGSGRQKWIGKPKKPR